MGRINAGHWISDGRVRLDREGVRFPGCRKSNGQPRFYQFNNEPGSSMIDWTAQILLKQKGISDLIQAIDQGVYGSWQLQPTTSSADSTSRPLPWRRLRRAQPLTRQRLQLAQPRRRLQRNIRDLHCACLESATLHALVECVFTWCMFHPFLYKTSYYSGSDK
jgi:hypothetical protein